MSTTNADKRPWPPEESVGPQALRGLAHPLRVKIIDLLSTHGALTASRLAELLGESSGSTSYHLRQLAKHGFVQEVQGKGTARERWWERKRDRFSITTGLEDDPSLRTAKGLVNAEFERSRQEKIWAVMRTVGEAPERYPEWARAMTMSTASVHATPEQVERLIAAVHAFMDEQLEEMKNQQGVPGTTPVQIHFNAFPVLDAAEVATGQARRRIPTTDEP